MSLDILITTSRLSTDPGARTLIEYLQQHAAALDIADAALYYDFPTYTDYDSTPHRPDILLVSPSHGVFAIRLVTGRPSDAALHEIDQSLGQFCSLLATRLLKSPALRRGITSLKFELTPIVFALDMATITPTTPVNNSRLVTSLTSLSGLIAELKSAALSNPTMDEMRSVIEGAKALTRAQRRVIRNPAQEKMATVLVKLETDIANFDQRQRRAALVNVPGPQRIRGLAGSGKTIILAMKAAHLHMANPEARILVTFMTSSLRSTIQSFITKFYRHYKDDDPNWDVVHVRHGWGGSVLPGAYSEACKRQGVPPIIFRTASAKAGRTGAFDYVCKDLLAKGVTPYYDHVLIDEGQDFPAAFYELCFELSKGERDAKSIVYTYDELQNVFDVKMPPPEELFGTDTDGQPRISLQRSGKGLPANVLNDMILRKSYRNQREVLITAHAVGFGIYGSQIVQLLESEEHWKDVGYRVLSGAAFNIGTRVRLMRPEANSPVALDTLAGAQTIETFLAPNSSDEFDWIIANIQMFLAGGLQREDILVVALDQPWSYLPAIGRRLAANGIEYHDVTDDRRGEPFFVPGQVALSAAYKAKGNEAAAVLVAGVGGIRTDNRSGRNTLFAAFTRSKAWLRISGIGDHAATIIAEVEKARSLSPNLEFTMPDLTQVETIQRGLSPDAASMKKALDAWRQKLRDEGMSEDSIEDMIAQHDLESVRPVRPLDV